MGRDLLLLCSFLCFFVSAHLQLIPNGSQQYYELYNKVRMGNLKQSGTEETSYTFQTKLKVNSVWNSKKEQLLEIYFSESAVSAPAPKNKPIRQEITTIPDRPFYISLIDGKPSKVIAHTSRDQSLLNLQRAIASLLQVQYANGPVRELDVSGQCNAFYAVKSTTKIEKTKTDCSHWDLRVNYRADKALGVLQHSQERVHFDLSAEGALLKVKSIETHRVALGANPNVGSQLDSELSLKHVLVTDAKEQVKQLKFETLDKAIESLLEWYRIFDIEADVDGAISEIKDKTLKQEIVAQAAQLKDEHIGKQTLAQVIAEILPLARITKHSEFVEILQEHKELHAQLVDLLAAVQTVDAHQAINEIFKYDQKTDVDLLEKYLQSLAVGTHPERAIIEDLFKRLQDKEQPIKNEKLRDTVVQTVAALTRQSGFEPNDALLQAVRTYILEQLERNCKEIDCKTLYIRALQNLQDASTIPTLLVNALEAEVPISVAAMLALKSFPITNFNEGCRKSFEQIFYQCRRKYDTTARTLALDILFAMKFTKQQLHDLLAYLKSNDRHFEIKTFVIQKLNMLAEKCPRFKAMLTACLAEYPEVNNYHIIAQKGLTTVLSRQLSQAPAFNESLLSVQEIYKGVLKRGSVELILHAEREETSIFKLGIYTSGLSSFVSDDSADNEVNDDDEDDDSPSSAGMEISVQGILLRPLIFFTGQTELMGHVWSGTASDPTPAYQATTITQNHEHYVVLASGATVYIRVIGTTSIDLNGKVSLSIWNRNANTEIQQNSGAAVVGQMIAGFTFAKVEHQFTLTNEPKIKLQADIDFYSSIKLCMQLQRPDMILTLTNSRAVYLNAVKPFVKRVNNKFTYKLPGRTLALNQKNNEMCNKIFE